MPPRRNPKRQPRGCASNASVSPFVGRAYEMARLEQHIRGEGPPVLLLAGEPGIGKTRLLDEVARSTTLRNMRVLRGGCSGPEVKIHTRPYWTPLSPTSAVRLPPAPCGSARPAASGLGNCFQSCRMELSTQLLPYATDSLPPEQMRRLLFAAVARFIEHCRHGRPAPAPDDLQWAGLDALTLLGALARSAPEIPLRVIGTYRDTEVHDGDTVLEHPRRAGAGRLGETLCYVASG